MALWDQNQIPYSGSTLGIISQSVANIVGLSHITRSRRVYIPIENKKEKLVELDIIEKIKEAEVTDDEFLHIVKQSYYDMVK